MLPVDAKKHPAASPAATSATREFTASGFCVLRTPLLPFQEFLALAQELSLAQVLKDGGDASSAANADRKLARERLSRLLERREVQEALWLASPEFFQSLSIWKQDAESAKGQRMERALYRYVARMSSRPTPFGLFAGCSLGMIAAETRMEVGPHSCYGRRSRLDMEYLSNLAEKITSGPELQKQLCFRPNSSLYLAGGRYHHAQSYLAQDARCYRLVATEPTPYLAATLERASAGATAAQLSAALVKDDPEITMEEAEDYVRQLIESQLLISDLTPPITGQEPIEEMLAQLGAAQKEEESVSATLKSVAQRLRALDEHGVGNDLADYDQIVAALRTLPCQFKLDHLVQVDMMKKPVQVSLDQRLVREILAGVEVLHSLAISPPSDPFRQFKEDFRERYQEEEIPLVLALDEDVGIGFERKEGAEAAPEPLIENIDFSRVEAELELTARKPEFALLRKLEELARAKQTCLELDDQLLNAIRVQDPLPLPDAFAVLGQIMGPPDPQGKHSFHLQNVSGPSGALLLGRFCSADEQLTTCVHEHLRREEACRAGENVIFAEIVHLPEGRIGNVLCRPRLREYEIPYLAASRAPQEHQIPITDLMLSLQNGRIVLRSQRLGCAVVPRLTSAHNYTHGRNLKLYKFLCLLQAQGRCGSLMWNWGILEQASFLPRVTLGNIVFAPARWRIGQETIEKLAGATGEKRLREIEEWRIGNGIPRLAFLVEADNQLLIDFENVLSVGTLVEYIKNHKSARLAEFLGGPAGLCAHGPEGSFTNEVIVPFVRKDQVVGQFGPNCPLPVSAFSDFRRGGRIAGPAQRGKRSSRSDESIKQTDPLPKEQRSSGRPALQRTAPAGDRERRFLPGSEWLFAKIYASPSQVDRLLLQHIRPLVANVLASGAADGWFFIRYGDPRWHLRLRFHGDPRRLAAEVLPQLRASLQEPEQRGELWRVQLDTYERELERYGGPEGLGIAERLFQYDSELVLELLASISDRLNTELRWHLGLTTVDQLLQALNFDLSMRRLIVNDLGKGQEKNLGVRPSIKKQLSDKFRNERQTVERLLMTGSEHAMLPAPATQAVKRFAEKATNLAAQLRSAQQAAGLTRSIEELAGSYVHMHLNRLFRSAANAQEMVLYDFLGRAYDSMLARERREKR